MYIVDVYAVKIMRQSEPSVTVTQNPSFTKLLWKGEKYFWKLLYYSNLFSVLFYARRNTSSANRMKRNATEPLF